MSFPGADVRIKESELESIDMRFVHRVLVAGPSEVGSGVEVFSVAVLAPMASKDTEVAPSRYHQLIVEAENPDSEQTRDRIRAKCMARWADGPGGKPPVG